MTDGPYRDLRVVVVGAGFAAGAHLRALLQMGCQVTAVVTGHPERRRAALAMFPDAEVDWPAPEAFRHASVIVRIQECELIVHRARAESLYQT